MTAAMVLEGLNKTNQSRLSERELDNFNYGKQSQTDNASDIGRSVKSEYDYGSKKKFVDVLGNIKTHQETLSERVNKNLDTVSHRSAKQSMTSS